MSEEDRTTRDDPPHRESTEPVGIGPRAGNEGAAGVESAGGDVELSESIRRMAGTYHPPPPTPREAIWARIDGRLAQDARPGTPGTPGTPGAARRTGRSVGPGTDRSSRRGMDRSSRTGPGRLAWMGRIAAAVALVALGFGAGRVSFEADGPPVEEAAFRASDGSATTPETEGVPSAVEERALDYFTRSGTLLASVRSDAREGVVGPGVGPWGRGLLQETRVMLDSPAADDPAMRALLEDLELVLAQVALLSDRERVGEARGREELRLIARGLDRRDLLPRIHAVLPSGTDLRTEEGDR